MLALTGPTGFLGQTIVQAARVRGMPLVALVRTAGATTLGLTQSCFTRVIGELGRGSIDAEILSGCTTVIHAAARAHDIGAHGPGALADYRRTNAAGTQALITAMAAAGVRRLVYVSSIKAVGERSCGRPLRPDDALQPEDDYGQSKAEAERIVSSAAEQGMEAIIVRPVLVHGPGARGNLQRLCKTIWHGRPLPLGGVENRRSMVGVDNLAEALLTAATTPLPVDSVANCIAPRPTEVDRPCRLKPALRSARPRIYHVADDGVISTRRLVEVLAEGMGVQPRLLHVPRWLAVGGATLLGKGAMARRLFDDLEVDDADFRRDFGWRPTRGLEEGLRMMAEEFAQGKRG